MSEPQLTKLEDEVKRLEAELELVKGAINTKDSCLLSWSWSCSFKRPLQLAAAPWVGFQVGLVAPLFADAPKTQVLSPPGCTHRDEPPSHPYKKTRSIHWPLRRPPANVFLWCNRALVYIGQTSYWLLLLLN